MYFLQCIDNLFNTKLHRSDIVKTVQNAHVFCMSIACGLGLVYYAHYSFDVIPFLTKMIVVQLSLDLFLTDKPDIFFHHIITLSMAHFLLSQFPVYYEIIQLPYAVIISTELSSFFLVLSQYLKEKTIWASVNNVCFVLSFFYTRIYLYLKYVVFNHEYMSFISETMSLNMWHSSIVFSFLFINMHWSSIIIKTIYKKLRPPSHSFCLNEFLLQYTYFLSPYISSLKYGVNSNPIFWLDIFGQSVLSVNSYHYHHAVYKKLKLRPQDKVNVLDDDICNSYVADIFSIQFRVFLVMLVNLSQLENGMIYGGLILSSQIFFGYKFYDYILDMKAQQRTILYGEDKVMIDYLLYLPIASVISIGIFHNNDPDASHHLILSSILLYNCIVIKPFYELNHFFLHLCLLYQSYAISAINASVLSQY
jgi:hypothetical protein